MLFSFFLSYKRNLKSASKEYQLSCNWKKQDNFFLRYPILYSKYMSLLRKGENISQSMLEKISEIEMQHMNSSNHHLQNWEDRNMPINHLEEMLCGWLALALTAGADPITYAKDMIDDADLNWMSKNYLLNKLTTVKNI
jgi:hypothetical protein